MPEWIDPSEWLEPKLLVLIVFIATVLFLARLGGGERAEPSRIGQPQRRTAAVVKAAQR
jgi:hypothetical protein